MKRLLQSILIALLIFVIGFTACSCSLFSGDDNGENNGDNIIDDGNKDDATDDGNKDDGNKDDVVAVDKTALDAEIALEITEQGDYTLDSYNAYAAKLAEAKAVADAEASTQAEVDAAAAALKAAREALAVRPVLEVEGGNKSFRLISGSSKEIAIADYVDANGLSKITYAVKTSNAVVELSEIANGKFTITAGDVREETDVTVTISVSYDGAKKLDVELNVKISNDVAPTLKNDSVVKKYDIFDLENKESFVINFGENIDNAGNLELTYSAKCGEEDLTLNGAFYTLALDDYADEYAYTTYTVTVSYEANGEAGTIQYTYKLGFRDTTTYRVANGNFEKGLEGWTLENTLGEAVFGGIDEKTTFWDQAFPMNNVGKYFSAYADGAAEASQGRLASPYFTVYNGTVTYMLGGAGNRNVYITVEDAEGNVLALYRNTEFSDFTDDMPESDRFAMVGDTIFLANFVTYKVDLSAYLNKVVRFVIHDYASKDWGVVFFDELKTYYGSDEQLPEGAVLAENLLADKAALNAELALEITAQGDYTADSYNAYVEKLAAAKALAGDIAATAAEVEEATKALTAARLALTVRPVLEVEGANKSFRLFSGNVQEIIIANYINENGLSNITYAVNSNSIAATLSNIADGKFTITAGEVSEATAVTVSIVVSYNGVEKLTVDLSIEITNDLAPTVFNAEVVESYDIFALENKASVVLDLSKNVDNAGNLELTYYVNGVAADALYTFTFGGNYTSEVTYETITVTVAYTANGVAGSIEYTYKLAVKDTAECRLENGGFENGLDGWTVVGNIGDVSSDSNYWVNDPESAEGFAFGMDGEKMFSAYALGAFEGAVGALTSSSFKVGGSGFVTFKIGAMRDGNYVYVDVVDAETKQILARYYNGLWAERTNDVKSGCTLIAYKADLSAFAGKEVFFRLSDNADSGYGLFFADSFVTYYEAEPDGFNAATPVNYEVSGTIYDVFNGGFEMGDNQGWWNVGEPGKVTGADAFFSGVAYGKDGNYLYSGVEDHGAGNGREGNTGVLTSSVFELGGSGYITYMLGGGNAICYVQVIDSTTGEILARYRQQAREDAVLKSYVADLSAYVGRTVRIQVVDNATSDWGCVSFDNVKTYYASKPEGFIDAVDVKYELVNGSFESGMEGWKQNITWAGAQNTLGWVESSEHDAGWYTKNDGRKDGNNLFTFCKPDGTNCENSKGTLDSATFVLKKDSYVSFRFGGAGTRDVHVQLCKANGEVIATFYNEAPGKVNTEMFAYYYQYAGEDTECFFRVVDNSESNYGCFVVDDFRVNLDSAPEGFLAAIQ